jgi:hypothetical protein
LSICRQPAVADDAQQCFAAARPENYFANRAGGALLARKPLSNKKDFVLGIQEWPVDQA